MWSCFVYLSVLYRAIVSYADRFTQLELVSCNLLFLCLVTEQETESWTSFSSIFTVIAFLMWFLHHFTVIGKPHLWGLIHIPQVFHIQTQTSVPDIVPVGSEIICSLFSVSASEVIVLRSEKRTHQRRQTVRKSKYLTKEVCIFCKQLLKELDGSLIQDVCSPWNKRTKTREVSHQQLDLDSKDF